MSRVYYAHSGNKLDKSDWQLLSDHLEKVACRAKDNARFFDATALAEVAGYLHDIGKYTKAFQRRLEGGKRVDHATAGCCGQVILYTPMGVKHIFLPQQVINNRCNCVL